MRKLSRTKNERRRLFQGLIRDVIMKGSVRTTLAKAKSVRPILEKTVTLAKKGKGREVEKVLASAQVEKKLSETVKTMFAKRQSGFTRIIRLGKRLGDATEEVMLQFVEAAQEPKAVKAAKAK